MLKILKKQGFASFVEVLVTSVIFVVAALGIFTTISMLRPRAMDSAERIEAAYAGKSVLDRLRAYVDQRSWNEVNSLLAPGVIRSSVVGNYIVNWYLEDVPGLGIRQLYMNVYTQ